MLGGGGGGGRECPTWWHEMLALAGQRLPVRRGACAEMEARGDAPPTRRQTDDLQATMCKGGP
jgi:hypothetical protein